MTDIFVAPIYITFKQQVVYLHIAPYYYMYMLICMGLCTDIAGTCNVRAGKIKFSYLK